MTNTDPRMVDQILKKADKDPKHVIFVHDSNFSMAGENTVSLTPDEAEALQWLLDRQLATSSFSEKGWMELLRGIREKLK